MKRTAIDMDTVADYGNLMTATFQAASGKRMRDDVAAYLYDLHGNTVRLREAILSGEAPYNHYKRFTIFDPKERVITAVCFKDRIIHHALMNHLGPVLEKALIPYTYACRIGKGPLQVVMQAQRCIRKYPWFVKIDIKKYFESIDHAILLNLLSRKIKGTRIQELLRKIINGFSTAPGKGIPIGSLTSQHFANYYLNGLDRFLFETMPIQGYVRYMDDMTWWCTDKMTAKDIVEKVMRYAGERMLLTVKENVQINRSTNGLTFCGFRIYPGSIRLSKRRKKRYTERRKFWENAYRRGLISLRMLQNAYAAVRGITSHVDCIGWMRNQLRLHPVMDI